MHKNGHDTPALPDDDDAPVGELLSRRAALRLLGLASGGALLGTHAASPHAEARVTSPRNLPGCVVRPAMAEGPYFRDARLSRRDIRPDSRTKRARPGVPLTLTFLVSRVALNACTPQSGVVVDVWHCDAAGAYSDVQDARSGTDTTGQDWLRGTQVTDARGRAVFTTIYPGWYPGRAVHVHFKLRTVQRASGTGAARRNDRVTGEFTSQLFFPEDVTDRVHAAPPYAARGRRDTPNTADILYRNGGSQLLVAVRGDTRTGLTATFDVGLNMR